MQKHHKSVFSVLLVVIIIAFVFTIGQVPFLGDRNSAWDEHKDFYGFDLSNQAVVSQLQTCAFYEAILGGMQIQTQQQLTRMILRQAYLLSLAKDLNIRQVSEAELRDYVQKAPIFLNPDGTFSSQLWNKFKQERIGTGRISDESLTFIIAQNALVSKMSKLLGGPGYVFKSEVEREYNQSYGTWDFNLAILEYDDFKPEIKVDPAALENYFPEEIVFVTTQELEDSYPFLAPKAREREIAKKCGAVFLKNIGGRLRSGRKHDGRAPDYDDWNLNGDILIYYPPLDCAFELSSMGIRVDEKSLLSQLEAENCTDRLKLPFHRALAAGELPLTMGGGIGQSRLCMIMLNKVHIGEVQVSVWVEKTRTSCKDKNIPLM